MCQLDSTGYEHSLALANNTTLLIGTIDEIQKEFIVIIYNTTYLHFHPLFRICDIDSICRDQLQFEHHLNILKGALC